MVYYYDDDQPELYHFGIKGMKWGVRRAERKAHKEELNKPNASYGKSQRSADRSVYGKGGVRRINRRMNKGQSHFKAQVNESVQRVAKTAIAYKASMFITSPEGVRTCNMAINKTQDFLRHNSVYMNYLRRRYGKGYKWNSPATEALKAIGNKVIIDATVAK